MQVNPDEYYWDKANLTRYGLYLSSIELPFIEESLPVTVEQCLDACRETGRASVPFKKTGKIKNLVIMDKNKLPLQIVRKKHANEKRLKLLLGDVQELPMPDESLNAVIAVQVMDYIPNRKKFYKECHRTLKEDGVFIVSYTNKNSYKALLHKIAGRDERFYSRSFSQNLGELVESGFRIEKVKGYGWPPVTRTSNNPLITVFAFLEKVLKLDRAPWMSPLLIAKAVKK